MDLPATQVVDEDELPCTQTYETNENNENCLVGTLNVDNKLHSIVSGVTTIGRHPACKIVLNHETISKTHAEIEAESANGAVFIRDLNSCNKTKINNTKLRPNSSYQIRNGDKLTFGKLTAIFKSCNSMDDSLISCTPQINRKIRSVIPGTPDSSLNASSASENDVSIVPGTQKDKTDTCFRMPQIPVKNDTSDEQRSPCVPCFSLEDFPSPLSNKNSNQDISEVETQRFITSDLKEDLDSSIYNVDTQKVDVKNKDFDPEDNIYEMETQRPCKSVEDKDEDLSIDESIENLETQKFDLKKNSFIQRKSMNVSVNNAESQKNVPNVSIDESIENMETQQFHKSNLDSESVQNKSVNESIYSAATQKIEFVKVTNAESIQNLETKRFDKKKLSSFQRKSMDASIYSADTQKCELLADESLENLETQRFEGRHSELVEKIPLDVSIYSAATQKIIPDSIENLETQKLNNRQSDSVQRKSLNVSIYSAATQKYEPESIENLQTQRLTDIQSDSVQNKSINVSIYNAATQKYEPESIENLETQQFDIEHSDSVERKSVDISICSIVSPTHKVEIEAESLIDKSLENLDILKYDNRNSGILQRKSMNKKESNIKEGSDESETLSNKICTKESTRCQEKTPAKNTDKSIQNTTASVSCNESFDDLETQEFNNESFKAIINESVDTAESKQFSLRVSNISDDAAEVPSTGNQSINKDIQNESEQCSTHDKSSNSVNEEKMSLSTSKSFVNEKSIEDDEDDMFCSQNLIEDCPFAFLPGESNIDNDLTNVSNKVEMKIPADDSDMNNSTKENDENTNNVKEIFEKSNEKSVILDDSETDEEGIFSNNLSKTDKSVISIENNHRSENENKEDSETDDEGIFSSHLSKEDKNKLSDTENEAEISGIKNSKSELEINEEILLDNAHTVPEEISGSNHEEDVETDEDIFENVCVNKENRRSTETSHLSIIENKSTVENSHFLDTSDENLFDEQDEVNKKGNRQSTKIKPIIKSVDEEAVDSAHSGDESVTIEKGFETAKINVQNDPNKDFLAPTQVIPQRQSPLVESVQESDDWHLNLAPTQEMEDSQKCTSSLSTPKVTRTSSGLNEINRNVSIENYEYERSATQPIDEVETRISMNSSKRQLEEIKMTSSKKLKSTRVSQSSKVDLNNTIEKSLNQMFDGEEEKPTDVSALLTQQLANILESSQTEDNPVVDSNACLPSPTISMKSSSRLKNRRKTTSSGKNDSLNTERSLVNLNDTIERNLNEMFDENINTAESYESDEMMTQQLTNVLQSQDNEPVQKEDSGLTRSRKLSLSVNQNVSKKLNKGRESKSLNIPSTRNLSDDEDAAEDSTSQEESQDNYFANLKSKRKINVLESQTEEEEQEDEEKSSETKLIRKRGTLGFSSEGQAVSSKACVELVEPKNSCFTNDSQSDMEEVAGAKGKKRFSLRLSESVDLNSSMSSASEHEVGSQISTREKKTPGRRSMGRAVCGFDASHEVVESHELVSAASTESDEGEEQQEQREPHRQEQESASRPGSACAGRTSQGPARSTLTTLPIVRTKRTIPSLDADAAANDQPTKRIKVADHKLQELSPAARNLDSPVGKRIARAPKALDCYVVCKNNSREASFNSSTLADEIDQRKSTITKLVAEKGSNATRAKTPVDSDTLNSNHSSKENLVVENSNVESVNRAGQTAQGRTRRQPNVVDASLIKNSSDEVPDSNDEQPKKRGARLNRLNQKKNVPVKESSEVIRKNLIIPDSDSDTSGKLELVEDKDEPIVQKSSSGIPDNLDLFINIGTRSRQAKVSQLSDSGKSNPKEIKNKKQTKNQKVKETKDSTDTDESASTRSTTNQKSRRNRELSESKNSNSKKADSPDINSVKKVQSTKNKRVKNSNNSDESNDTKSNEIENSSIGEKDIKETISVVSDVNINKTLRSKRGQAVIETSSQESVSTFKTRSKRGQDNTDSSSQKSIVTSRTKNKRGSEHTDSSSQEPDIPSKTKSSRGQDSADSNSQESVTASKSRSKRNQDVADSSSQESVTTSKSRSRRGQDKMESNSQEVLVTSKAKSKQEEKAADSSSQESVASSKTRSRRGQKVIDSNSQESLITSKTRSRRGQDNTDSNSQESETTSSSKTEKNKQLKNTKDSQPKSSEVVTTRTTASRSAKTRNQLVDSVALESNDTDKDETSTLPNKNITSRSKRGNRKRLASPVVEETSSEESQEVAEIIQSSMVDEKSSKTSNLDSTFERPVSRPKRQRLTKTKSVKNQPALERSSADDEDSESNVSQRSTSRRAQSPKSLIVSTPKSISRTRRSVTTTPKNGPCHKVLFTGEKSKVHRQIVANLGGSEVEDPAKCTILVTNKILRTYKLLCSLARGIPIVSIKWLEDSNKAQHFLDWEDYILNDPEAEAKFQFNLKESLKKASKHKLLEDYTILLTPKITQPPISELKGMVTSSGGKPLVRAPAKWSEKIVVVTKNDDLKTAMKMIAKAPKSTLVHSIEFLLTGILRQEINLKEFILTD